MADLVHYTHYNSSTVFGMIGLAMICGANKAQNN